MSLPTPTEIRDRNVQQTDFDALGARYASVSKNYLDDRFVAPFVQGLSKNLVKVLGGPGNTLGLKRALQRHFSPQSVAAKLPIINRGTYIRTAAVDSVIRAFITKSGGKCRVVSVGAGLDTRIFRLLQDYPNLEYIETDFEQTTKLKASIIIDDLEMWNAVMGLKSRSEFQDILETEPSNVPSSLEGPRYRLQGLDLREREKVSEFFASLAGGIPTLILAECVFCYLEPSLREFIMETAQKYLQKRVMVLYEPMTLNDEFGRVMVGNLQGRGLVMPGVMPTLELEKERAGRYFGNVFCSDMNEIYEKWIDEDEKKRVSRLELLDEVEEWVLLLKHYALVVAQDGIELNLENRHC